MDSWQYHLPASFPQTPGTIQTTTRIFAPSPQLLHSTKTPSQRQFPSETPSQQRSWKVHHWTLWKPGTPRPIKASHSACCHPHRWDTMFPGDLLTIQLEPELELSTLTQSPVCRQLRVKTVRTLLFSISCSGYWATRAHMFNSAGYQATVALREMKECTNEQKKPSIKI